MKIRTLDMNMTSRLHIKRFFTLLFLVLVLVLPLEAQYGKKKKKRRPDRTEQKEDGIRIAREDERGSDRPQFIDNLWYGSGIQLGFGGNNFESSFQLGLSPMVGYRVTEWFSVGPRISYQYLAYRRQLSTEVQKAKVHSFGVGGFTRFNFLQQFLIHAEYEKLFSQDLFDGGSSGIIKRPFNQNILNVGGGIYQSSGTWGFAQYLLIDVLDERESGNIPIQIRFEVNYLF